MDSVKSVDTVNKWLKVWELLILKPFDQVLNYTQLAQHAQRKQIFEKSGILLSESTQWKYTLFP